jgi:hypothetical protein
MAAQNLQPTAHGDASEDLLRDRAIKYEIRTVQFSDIDLEASARNQARFLAIHPETVELYAAAMSDGAVFPPIVVTGNKPPYTVADGNHRLRAALVSGFDSASMIVITGATAAQKELFTYEANAKHGLPTSLAERVAQGVYLVGLGNQAVDVAAALGIPERKLWAAVAAKRARQRLERLGVPIGKNWSESTFRRLGSVRSDVVLTPLARLIVGARLSVSEIDPMITRINSFSSEGQAIAYIEDRTKALAPMVTSTAGGALALPKEINTLRIGLRMFRNMDPGKLGVALLQVDPEFRTSLGRETVEAVGQLMALAAAFKA